MIIIPAILVNGIFKPATAIDFASVSGITFDGVNYTVYEKALNEEPPALEYNDDPIDELKTEEELGKLLIDPSNIVEFQKYYAAITSKSVDEIKDIASAADAAIADAGTIVK